MLYETEIQLAEQLGNWPPAKHHHVIIRGRAPAQTGRVDAIEQLDGVTWYLVSHHYMAADGPPSGVVFNRLEEHRYTLDQLAPNFPP